MKVCLKEINTSAEDLLTYSNSFSSVRQSPRKTQSAPKGGEISMAQYITCRTFKFSNRGLDGLPDVPTDHPSSNVEYTDSAESGLRAAKYKSGKISFRYRYTLHGVKHMITIGSYPAVGFVKARVKVREYKDMLADGLNPKDELDRVKDAPSFEAFCNDVYLPFAKKERRSYRDIENRIKLRLLKAFGKKKLSMISKRDISGFHLKLRQDVSRTTANRYLALISGIFAKSIEWGYLTENPARGIKKFKENGFRKRVLSKEEFVRFMKALMEVIDTPPGKAIFLLISLGLRKNEVLSMTWSHIDFDRKHVYLPHTKSGVPRYATLNRTALDLLRQMYAERNPNSDWVFPSRSSKGHLLEVRRTLTTVLKKADIKDFRLHDCRKVHASILVNSGVSVLQVRDILGHSDVRTTQIYAHLATSSLEDASEKAAIEIEKAIGSN
jgi:integrase